MRKEQRALIKNYEQSLKHRLFTTRFNNDTHFEFTEYLRKKNKGCIYSTPIQIANKIPLDKLLFVLEMNNSENRIMGIGIVKNHPHIKKYHIFSDHKYNRYNYVGSYRISRESMNERENEVINALEYFCFKGPTHLKRQQGLTKFPTVLLYK